jgi:hypothetical protein
MEPLGEFLTSSEGSSLHDDAITISAHSKNLVAGVVVERAEPSRKFLVDENLTCSYIRPQRGDHPAALRQLCANIDGFPTAGATDRPNLDWEFWKRQRTSWEAVP